MVSGSPKIAHGIHSWDQNETDESSEQCHVKADNYHVNSVALNVFVYICRLAGGEVGWMNQDLLGGGRLDHN